MTQPYTDQVAGFFPVPPPNQLNDTRPLATPAGATEILDFFPAPPEHEDLTRGVPETSHGLDESNSIPQFFPVPKLFPTSRAHRGSCSGAIPAQQEKTDDIPEFFPASPAHRGFRSGARHSAVLEEPDTENISQFFPISPVHRGSPSRASATPQAEKVTHFLPASPLHRGSPSGASATLEAEKVTPYLPVSPHHQGFHTGVLNAPFGFGRRTGQSSAGYAGRQATLQYCPYSSAGECSWMTWVRETQPELRDIFSRLLAIRQSRGLDFCFTGIPFRYRDHVGPRCKTLINAMLFVQCSKNWSQLKSLTGVHIRRTRPTKATRDCRVHGTCIHPLNTIASVLGREKWTYYVNNNLPVNKIPRRFKQSMSHACDYGLLCNDMDCVDMEPMEQNSLRWYHCFSIALANYDAGKQIPKFCNFPDHSAHPCHLWRAIEHQRHRMSMIIKEFAFFLHKNPEQLSSTDIGPFFQLTYYGVPVPNMGIDDLDFSYVTWDHSNPSVPQRPRIFEIQRPVSTELRPEEVTLFVQARWRTSTRIIGSLYRFLGECSDR